MKLNLCLVLIFMSLILSAQENPENGSHYLVDISTLTHYGIDTMASIPMGIPIGSPVDNFKTKDQHGQTFDLYKNLEKGPVVLVFYRGHWCGICNKHLKRMESSLTELKNLGAQVVAITPESAEGVKGTIKKTHASFPILSDSNNEILNQFDVTFHVTDDYTQRIKKSKDVSIAKNNHQSEATLPVPATYVIGTDKKVIYNHFDPNYRNRLSVEDLTTVLKEM